MTEQKQNGVVVEKRKHRRVNPLPEPRADQFKRVMTVSLGCFIPLLSLALSKIAGTLATFGNYPLSAFAFVLMVAVLAVSLPHLAWAISDMTRSGQRNSWCLAVALDMSLVLSEFVITFAGEAGLGWVVYTVMAAVCVFSMAFNCWAFFKAPHGN